MLRIIYRRNADFPVCHFLVSLHSKVNDSHTGPGQNLTVAGPPIKFMNKMSSIFIFRIK